MRRSIIITILILNYLFLSGQSLKRKSLTKADKEHTVRWRYEYRSKEGFFGESLLLFKSGRYKYEAGGCLQGFFSEGRWAVVGNEMILNSDVKKNDVPVSVSYTNDTSDIVNAFKFGIVRNRKGDLMTDAFVIINNDSVKCLPMAGGCVGTYNRIDSVRLQFENGFTSRWMGIANNDKHVLIRAEVDIKIEGYKSFDNVKYRLHGKLLIPDKQ
ncbi:hypothetical protein [Chitinophaga niabensis]|uniref:Uncharacterized protein n=1 Tax=Chitinophaga niabensis TaxID=536979 RepID=A0A1N6KG52_9BACT|nr:hypothetical protein [Chitinophaga niabensis]SIO55569.1 hypothetical protein SAMN04488055_5787 [Chitinophaga niabensis]